MHEAEKVNNFVLLAFVNYKCTQLGGHLYVFDECSSFDLMMQHNVTDLSLLFSYGANNNSFADFNSSFRRNLVKYLSVFTL